MTTTSCSPGQPDPLPAPTGAHAVGRTSYDWVDPARTEIYATGTAGPRELIAWVWYPAEPDQSASFAAYVPDAWRPSVDFLGVDTAGLLGHSVPDAPPATGGGRFPVLALSPSGFPPLLMGVLAEELASHGYVVVGVNHTYETGVTVFRDGRVIPANPSAIAGALGAQSGSHETAFGARRDVCEYKAADLAFVGDQLGRIDADRTDRFAGRLDLTRLGSLGHSFGGNAALEWCRLDPRCRAAVNLDGAIWTEVGTSGLDRPALQILAEHREFDVSPEQAVELGMAPSSDWFAAEKTITFEGWRTVHEHAQPGYTMRITGATHLSFLDIPFLPQSSGGPAASMLAATTISPVRMWRITSDLVLAFFARHLDGAAAPTLDGPDPNNPEILFGPA